MLTIRVCLAGFALCPLVLCFGCSGTEGAATGKACAESNLIEQCPPGSDPLLDAESVSACQAAGNANFVERSGKVTGKCEGSGECQVLCQFEVPCDCGVDAITNAGVMCTDCNMQASCGDGTCSGGEDATTCPSDCGMVCRPDEQRCNGITREVCNLQGTAWDTLDCLPNEQCREVGSGMVMCERTSI